MSIKKKKEVFSWFTSLIQTSRIFRVVYKLLPDFCFIVLETGKFCFKSVGHEVFENSSIKSCPFAAAIVN